MHMGEMLSFSSIFSVDDAERWEDDGINPVELNFEESVFDCEDLLSPQDNIDYSQRLINFQDYTLNSPLIIDELQSFLNYMHFGKVNPLFSKKLWERRKKWIDAMAIPYRTIKTPEEFHSIMAKELKRKGVSSILFKNIMDQSNKNAAKTHEVLQAYVRTWLNHHIPYKSRNNLSSDTIKYGSFMMDLLVIIWILNAASDGELTTLTAEFKLQPPLDPEKDQQGRTFNSETLGPVAIGYGLVYIAKWNMFLDRNMTLMFKDLCTARFHSLLAIYHRQFDKYDPNHGPSLEKLYTLGDSVLEKEPVKAYEVFSMIEPITSFQLSELARSHRPEIPTFPHFLQHINAKKTELQESVMNSEEFLEHLSNIADKRMLLTAYGSFRHWGHPFINYLEGLKALHHNVQMKTEVNIDYAEQLASDLAYKVLHRMFLKNHRWYVDHTLLDPEHPLKEHVKKGTWPTAQSALDYKDGWHKLPLLKCWDVPEVVDPAILYSDKTHSINRDELIDHMKTYPGQSIPTRKVLETFIQTAETNWPKFLQDINDFGLDRLYKVIGLKAKEREIKWRGRFFALMSWQLREYFVFTEYLIKKEILPLFSGLTMADDQTTLTKKMLDNTSGQGQDDYRNVTIANHIDYNKWNNFQRKEATNPTFRVMGQFFGYPNLFTRTHEFFEESLIYYRDRPDLMSVRGDTLVSLDPEYPVCWDGQLGGLEGLRQKGWSVLNLLVIERESKIRNTKVQILAQGDNQVICTMYEIHPHKNDAELNKHITDLVRNNSIIMKRIREATHSIGLFINEDETLQSADMLIYGKNIIYRGNVTCLEEKRYSRVTCTTNDQLPGLGNVMATVATNCLTVAHYSRSPLNAMVSYNWLSNFVCSILHLHNPALRKSPNQALDKKDSKIINTPEYLIGLIYLDPSLGGISGMSLARFHIRMFPDPITEGLSFWKAVAKNAQSRSLSRLCSIFGNPKPLSFREEHFEKLLEDPNSLNLPRGLSAKNLLRNVVKKLLLNSPEQIGNKIVQDAVNFMREEFTSFISFLESINPCFPRFISEFKAATYLGMTESIVGLFENSKTLRSIFRKRLRKEVDTAIIKCEIAGIRGIINMTRRGSVPMWRCSSTQADELRRDSWGREVIGTTVPHPLEMMSLIYLGEYSCEPCRSTSQSQAGVIVLLPQGLPKSEDIRGPFPPYFGSTTDENTSLVQTWEKTTDISFLRRASNMRRVFSWFVSPDGNLGRAIYDNLQKLTGEDPGQMKDGFSRTGSALHRFGCSRVSAGGFMASSPQSGSWMIISSDKFQVLGIQNYDFMYQSCMIYAQQTAGELYRTGQITYSYHFHVGCLDCLRPIDDHVNLITDRTYQFPDVSEKLKLWKPALIPWFKTRVEIEIPTGDWDSLTDGKKSFELGQIQGYMFSDLHISHGESGILNGLFPIGIRDKVDGYNYLKGVQSGLFRGAVYNAMKRRLFYRVREVSSLVTAGYTDLVSHMCDFSPFLVFCQGEGINIVLSNSGHRIPPSYPINRYDLGVIIKNYLMRARYPLWIADCRDDLRTYIFADFNAIQLSGMLIVGHLVTKLMLMKGSISNFEEKLRSLKDFASAIKSEELTRNPGELIKGQRIYRVTSEVRHAFKNVKVHHYDPRNEYIVFSNKVEGKIRTIFVDFTSVPEPMLNISYPQKQNPLISGIRIPQLATGAFLKMTLIVQETQITAQGILCGGDGSGGISSYLLRQFPNARLIFNSLLDMSNVPLGGSLPKPPSAIDQMDNHLRIRCVNLDSVYEHPTDLSLPETWWHFVELKKKHNLIIDLIVLDMEIVDERITDKIDQNILRCVGDLLSHNGVLILKSYAERLTSPKSAIQVIGPLFREVQLIQTDWSSSHTSEIYVKFKGFRTKQVVVGYVSWSGLESFLRDTYVRRSYRSEFERALKMVKYDIVTGIPKMFLPDPYDEILSLWIGVGGDGNQMSRWIRSMPPYLRSDPAWTACATIGLVCQGTLGIMELTTGKIKVPADNELEKLFGFMVGTWLYMSLIKADVITAYRVQELIDHPFQINLYSVKWGFGKNKGDVRSLKWKIRSTGGTTKMIHLSRRMALIGRTIRLWLSLSKEKGSGDMRRAFDGIGLLKRDLTFDNLMDYTDIFYPYNLE